MPGRQVPSACAGVSYVLLAFGGFSRHTIRTLRMLNLKNVVRKPHRALLAAPRSRTYQEREQRSTMIIALALLLVALGFVLYHDRDFWFPETQEAQQAEDQPQPQQTAPAITNPTQTAISQPTPAAREQTPKKKFSRNSRQAKLSPAVKVPAAEPSAPPIAASTTRTVLPPLEVEVVAGDVHRTLHPGTNSVRVDLQPGSPAQPVAVPPTAGSPTESAASVTSNAAEHVQMSADTADIVSRPVRPGYPLLARQMKVEGSVILQALVGRDGLIQDLRVLSGPPILASAAQEAVKQWHFKPHYQGIEAVETQARITVNFTISTN
jgi:TonB family protein